MGQVTQQSAAYAEEGASASEELRAQADLLRDLVVNLGGLIHGGKGNGSRISAYPPPGDGRNSAKPAGKKAAPALSLGYREEEKG